MASLASEPWVRACSTPEYTLLTFLGYPMAANLRRYMAVEDSLVLYDVNQEATHKLQGELESEGRAVEVVSSAREAVEQSVSYF